MCALCIFVFYIYMCVNTCVQVYVQADAGNHPLSLFQLTHWVGVPQSALNLDDMVSFSSQFSWGSPVSAFLGWDFRQAATPTSCHLHGFWGFELGSHDCVGDFLTTEPSLQSLQHQKGIIIFCYFFP